jgi:hypothetical protein
LGHGRIHPLIGGEPVDRHLPAIRRFTGALIALLAGATGVARAQDAVIRGTVRSDIGAPLGAAIVSASEAHVQAATRATGAYVLRIPAARMHAQTVLLHVRAARFLPETRSIALRSGEQTVDVRLRPDPNGIEEAVAAGGIEGAPRAGAPVAVARLAAEDLPTPAVDPLRQLAGRVPGALVTGVTGRPGASPDVVLGGSRSLEGSGASQAPLYIVDGVLVYSGMPAIDGQDIDHIEVVTRSAAAPLYGSRAANGVVAVTTRSGASSARAVGVHFRSEAGVDDIERTYPVASQHALLTDATGRRFCIADPSEPLCARTLDWSAETERVNGFPGDSAATPTTLALDPGRVMPAAVLRQNFVSRYWPTPVYDAARQVTRGAPFVHSSADVFGRVGGTGYLVSASQLRERGSIRSLDGATRYTARVNLDQRLGSAVSLAVRSFYGRDRSDGFSQESGGSLFQWVTQQPASADLLARDSLGRLHVRSNILSGGALSPNPLLYTTGNGITDDLTTERALGGVSLDWSPLEWLDAEASAGVDRRTDRWDHVLPLGLRTPGYVWASPYGETDAVRWWEETRSAAFDVTMRRSIGAGLSTVWSVRIVSEQHRATARNDSRLLRRGAGSLPPRDTDVISITTAGVTQRLTGLSAGASFTYRGRYVADLLIRRDRYGPGEDHPHATLARAAFSYRMSAEPWWPLAAEAGEFSLRASLGKTGSAPGYPASSEDLLAGVALLPGVRGETTTERAVGADIELFHRVGVDVTYSRSETKELIAAVPVPSQVGFFSPALANIGSLRNTTWELSVHVPVVRTRDLTWSWRFNYDRSRAVFGKLDVPPFTYGDPSSQSFIAYMLAREGERVGTLYGHYVLRGAADCAKLPAPFSADCGTANSSFQTNSDGYLVWVGKDQAGNAYHVGDGLARNLWTTRLPAASAPWGAELSWGMLIPYRDTTGARRMVPLGTALPDWHFSVSQELRWRRLRVYALLEAVIGRDVWNLARQEAYLDLTDQDVEQRGVDPALAKPLGYYYRSGPPESGAGIGGLAQTLDPYNGTVEDASFAKLRELSVTWHLGRIAGVGSWDVSVIGRNVFTITRLRGFDPEVGTTGGPYATGTLSAVESYTFPNLRTVTLALSTSF